METQANYGGPITYNESIEAATRELAKAKEGGENLLMPSDSLNNVPPMHKVTVERVRLSPDPIDKDIYVQQGNADDPPEKKRYAVTKEGLLKLSSCAGVQWDYDHSCRIDRQDSGQYIAWRMVGAVQRLDGSWLPLQGAYDLDFDVIEEQILDQKRSAVRYWANAKWWKEMNSDQKEAYILKKTREDLLMFKRHKVARCETGAMLRAIRGLLNVKGTYSHAELQKPFVIARLVFQPDYADPYIKAQAVALAFRAMQGVYGIIQAPSFPQPRQIPAHVIDMEGGGGSYEMPHQGDEYIPAERVEPEPEPDSEAVDFENSDKSGKVKALEALCKRKGFVRKQAKALDQYTEKGLTAFYEKLIAMPDLDDDIPG